MSRFINGSKAKCTPDGWVGRLRKNKNKTKYVHVYIYNINI
jgi:hypothetical protein